MIERELNTMQNQEQHSTIQTSAPSVLDKDRQIKANEKAVLYSSWETKAYFRVLSESHKPHNLTPRSQQMEQLEFLQFTHCPHFALKLTLKKMKAFSKNSFCSSALLPPACPAICRCC